MLIKPWPLKYFAFLMPGGDVYLQFANIIKKLKFRTKRASLKMKNVRFGILRNGYIIIRIL